MTLINTETKLRKLIRTIIREDEDRTSLYHQALKEKEMQDATTPQRDASESSADAPQQTTSQPSDDDAEQMKKGDIAFEDIVDKLNTIRSGKSFKSAEVAATMKQYVDDLKPAERTALFAFLKGMAQIVTGEIPAEDAANPAEPPSDVDMKKAGEEGKKTVVLKPTVIKGAPKEKKAAVSAEDTAGPVPLTPKKR